MSQLSMERAGKLANQEMIYSWMTDLVEKYKKENDLTVQELCADFISPVEDLLENLIVSAAKDNLSL